MSLIDTDAIWFALGDFYNLFPEEERDYWTTFWDAYGDIIADLWGYAFQVDRAKSLFSASATFERRGVLIRLSNLSQGVDAAYRISSLRQDAGGRWLLRGFVPRDKRTFKASDLPDKGVVRIGSDVIGYLQVNSTTIVGGVYDGFVRDSTFVLDEEPPHDYGDDPDFNNDFALDPLTLSLRLNHPVSSLVIDATGSGSVNPSGVIDVGGESVEYESVTILADRYLFQLASPTTQTHAQDLEIEVQRHDVGRWRQELVGDARIVSRGKVTLVTESSGSRARLLGQYKIRENSDFDLSVAVRPDEWPDPTIVPSSKRMYLPCSAVSLFWMASEKSPSRSNTPPSPRPRSSKSRRPCRSRPDSRGSAASSNSSSAI